MKALLAHFLIFLLGFAARHAEAQQPSAASAAGQCFSQWTAAMNRQGKRWDETDAGREEIKELIWRAEALCVAACNQGNAPACLKLTKLYEADEGCPIPFDPVQAADPLRCEGHDRTGETRDAQVQLAYEKSQSFIQLQCEQGRVKACNKLATLYLYLGDEKLPGGRSAVAAELYGHSCRQSDYSACYKLADLYEKGEGITQDKQKADELNELATKLAGRQSLATNRPKCDEGDMDACYHLGMKLEWDIGVERNPDSAKPLFAKACDHDHATSCDELARIHEGDSNQEKGKAIAKVLYQKACDLGERAGCDNLRLLNSGATERIISGVRIISTAGDMYEQLFISDE